MEVIILHLYKDVIVIIVIELLGSHNRFLNVFDISEGAGILYSRFREIFLWFNIQTCTHKQKTTHWLHEYNTLSELTGWILTVCYSYRPSFYSSVHPSIPPSQPTPLSADDPFIMCCQLTHICDGQNPCVRVWKNWRFWRCTNLTLYERFVLHECPSIEVGFHTSDAVDCIH